MDAAGGREQYLTFDLGGIEHAIAILSVREILEYQPVTRVPTTPPFVHGVLNLRGSVVPVVDLGAKLGMAQSAITKRSCFIFVELALGEEKATMGVLVDAVSQVLELAPDEIEPPPPFANSVRVEYLKGLGRVGSSLVLLLDVEKVLSSDEVFLAFQLNELEEASVAAPPLAEEPAAEPTQAEAAS